MNAVSFSGGKDSTAMLLMMLDRGIAVDEVLRFDTGWEFPELDDHIAKVEAMTGIKVTTLHPKVPFDELMTVNHRTMGKRKDISGGYGWPSALSRWCTTIKTQTIDRHLKGRDAVQFVGIAADEVRRCKEMRYPLVEWGVTEADALEYCRSLGFDWFGLYEHRHRVSCWCCPLQSLDELRALRRFHPDLWDRLLLMDMAVNRNPDSQCRFRRDYTLPEIEQRFRNEDAQMMIGDSI